MEEISSIIQELVQPLPTKEPALDKSKTEQYKLLLDKCPLWLLKRLKEEIQKRIELQNDYNNNMTRIKEFEKQLQTWKEATDAEIAKKHSHYEESVNKLNEQIQKYEQQLVAKDQQIAQLQESLNTKDKEIASYKAAAMTQSLTPVSRQGSTVSLSSLSSVTTPSPTAPTPISSSTSVGTKQAIPEELETMAFKSFKGTWLDLTSKSDLVLELLFKNDLVLVSSICEVAPTKDDVIKSIIHLFEARGQAQILLESLIVKEVAKTKTEATLFRSNSVASKMLSLYTKMLGGSYLREILQPTLQSLITSNQSLEIDPNKVTGGEDIAANLAKIKSMSEELLNVIINSVDKCPYQFRQVCACLYDTIAKKFPEDPYNGIKNFIFLRYICPSVLSPSVDIFGIPEIPDNARRTLLLLSKILQNIINGAEFKEAYLRDLNPFVTSVQASIRSCLHKYAELPPDDKKVVATIPKHFTIKESSKVLISSLGDVKDVLIDRLHSYDGQQYTQPITFNTSERLVSVCVELGMPMRKNKKVAFIQGDPKTEDLISLVADEEKLTTELVDIAYSEKDNKLLQGIVSVVCAHEQRRLVPVIKNLITKEIKSTSYEQFLKESVTQKTFIEYTKLICGDYIKEWLTPTVNEIVELKDELKSGTDKLMEVTQKLLATLLKSLNTSCPSTIYDIIHHVYVECVQEAKNSKIPPVSKVILFLFDLFFCEILENPDSYTNLPDLSKKKVKKGLTLCSELLRQIAKSEVSDSKMDPRVVTFIAKRREISLTLIEDWVTHNVEFKTGSLQTIPWPTMEEYLKNLHSTLGDKLNILSSRLSQSGLQRSVTFKLSEMIDQLITSKDAFIKSSVF